MAGTRLALGTVQFGLAYGIANRHGQVAKAEAAAILARAGQAGMGVLDTAIAYGRSEQCLGEVGVPGWRIVTKLPGMPEQLAEAEVEAWLHDQVAGSLHRLGVDQVDALLLHRSGDLLGARGQRLLAALTGVRARGWVGALGVSIYAPDELAAVWPRFQPAIVQSPYNVFDRRLAASGWLTRLADAGVRVHVRSAFLQGLLLMSESDLPEYFQPWADVLGRWRDWCRQNDCPPLRAALGLALDDPRIDRVIVGVDTLAQLEEILSAAALPARRPPDELASDDLNLIDPRRWNR